ncbi:molybdate ABC transporter substrate-binding protein [Caenimonas koreensis]|uniref:molybdate ABC transporter substrate-binding protein n=1 Tax=Caenimonas koreensis TaxID=367474 RepID=UPI002B270B3F|nr:substrate-binding domain-containing protein [Caenimonas koreensis]
MVQRIRLLSGGAAQGLVGQLQQRLLHEAGVVVEGTFNAVGAMRDKLLAGEPCDALILTQQLIAQLVADGHVVAGSDVAVGVVRTGVAVKAGARVPDVSGPEALRAALLAADGIYFPDPLKATAGIHFMKVLRTLGIADELGPRLRAFPNGATAMREMAGAAEAGVIGCTQVTEILYTPGVQLADVLPKEFELATVYTAGVCSKAQQPQAAAAFIAMLAGVEAKAVREAGGFEA